MGITCDRGRYYWVKRVPRRYEQVVLSASGRPVQQVRVALKTDSLSEAKRLAPQIEAAKIAEWNALLGGDHVSARQHYEGAKQIAEARGFSYVPIASLCEGDLAELVARTLSLVDKDQRLASRAVVEAVLGAVPVVMPGLRSVLDEYVQLTVTRHLQKSEAQKRKWLLPRQRAVRNFLNVMAGTNVVEPEDVSVDQITRADALRFRTWWSGRVEAGMKVESANKDLSHLSQIIKTWSELSGEAIENPFAGLRLDGKDGGTTPPFSAEWIQARLLAPEALAGLNVEARDVFLMMVNTGLRPSEISDAPVEDFVLEHEVPHMRVAAHGRQLKVAHTARDIPLLGVSLEAARRIVARTGIQRYAHKAGSWSGLVNKYLATHGLKETPKHVAYSLRHSVEDRLLEAGVDDRVRADILGHKYHRPVYGTGGGLVGRRDALSKIAF